jgi:hypothetical protein
MPPKGKLNSTNNKNENLPEAAPIAVAVSSGNDEPEAESKSTSRWLNIDESTYNGFISAESEQDEWRYFVCDDMFGFLLFYFSMFK